MLRAEEAPAIQATRPAVLRRPGFASRPSCLIPAAMPGLRDAPFDWNALVE